MAAPIRTGCLLDRGPGAAWGWTLGQQHLKQGRNGEIAECDKADANDTQLVCPMPSRKLASDFQPWFSMIICEPLSMRQLGSYLHNSKFHHLLM